MIDIALAKINSLPKTIEVPQEEQLITLTYGQLSELITGAIEKAIQPLQDQLSDTRAIIDRQDEKITALEATVNTLADNQFIQLQLIGQLRETTKKEITPGLKDRADILRALVVANGGKMLLSSARQKMHLRKDQLSQLLATMKDEAMVKPLYSDKKKWLLY